MSKYLCADCVAKEQCNGEWTTHCVSYVPKEYKQTNDEWRRTCSTEEFAEFLNLIIRVGPYENEPKDFWEHVYGRGGDRGAKSIVEWLKEIHK